MKKFDLNIEKILEDWETHHAIREVIANALDEQKLSNSEEIQIFKDSEGNWHIRDFGRGIRPEHFTQNENDEKLHSEGIIGKFGIGLKDALATFDRKNIEVIIKSKYGEFTVGKSTKLGFESITTLHIYVNEPNENNFIGTEFILCDVDESSISLAKKIFLIYSDEKVLEATRFGQVLSKNGSVSKIFINGVKVAEEENFLFSYNITLLNSAIKKALNRERTNVGRGAYSERVKSILLSCNSWKIAEILINDLQNFTYGKKHDELNWIDVQEHATKIYSKVEKVVFATSSDIEGSSDIIEEVKDTGHKLVVIPENLKEKVHGSSTEKMTLLSEKEIEDNPKLVDDLEESGHQVIIVPEEIKEKSVETNTGNVINDFSHYVDQRNENFQFKFIHPNQLNQIEKHNYNLLNDILSLIGGKPNNIDEFLISETMQRDNYSFNPAEGLYQSLERRIIIKRSVLNDKRRFIEVLLHEIAHAISGASDATRDFEEELTKMLGIVGNKALEKLKIESKPKKNKNFWDKIFE